jgi:hypothetical protein
MPLPDNFSAAEHLQDVILLTQNKIVRTEFNDVGDDNWVKDISTPRASLRLACTHEEDDSIDMTILRSLASHRQASKKLLDIIPKFTCSLKRNLVRLK